MAPRTMMIDTMTAMTTTDVIHLDRPLSIILRLRGSPPEKVSELSGQNSRLHSGHRVSGKLSST